jgi:hypothetical protein
MPRLAELQLQRCYQLFTHQIGSQYRLGKLVGAFPALEQLDVACSRAAGLEFVRGLALARDAAAMARRLWVHVAGTELCTTGAGPIDWPSSSAVYLDADPKHKTESIAATLPFDVMNRCPRIAALSNWHSVSEFVGAGLLAFFDANVERHALTPDDHRAAIMDGDSKGQQRARIDDGTDAPGLSSRGALGALSSLASSSLSAASALARSSLGAVAALAAGGASSADDRKTADQKDQKASVSDATRSEKTEAEKTKAQDDGAGTSVSWPVAVPLGPSFVPRSSLLSPALDWDR